MQAYLDLVKHVLHHGVRKENRTGVDTLSTFNYNYEVELSEGFPLLTTKSVSWKNIVVEMLWFLSGQTDISILKRHGCKFWDDWADPVTGKVPSAYGNFWRQFPVHGVRREITRGSGPGDHSAGYAIDVDAPTFNDQIAWVLSELRRNPMSRRMVVSAWAPGNAQTSKLPPCHCLFMLNVQNVELDARKLGFAPLVGPPRITEQRLCLSLLQRSADIFLGVPYNIASYALLLLLFSRFSGIKPGIFAHTLVDAHAYTAKPDGSQAEYDHIPQLKEQISRAPRPLPRLIIDDSIQDLNDVERLMHPSVSTEEVMRHFRLEEYDPHPALHGKVAV